MRNQTALFRPVLYHHVNQLSNSGINQRRFSDLNKRLVKSAFKEECSKSKWKLGIFRLSILVGIISLILIISSLL